MLFVSLKILTFYDVQKKLIHLQIKMKKLAKEAFCICAIPAGINLKNINTCKRKKKYISKLFSIFFQKTYLRVLQIDSTCISPSQTTLQDRYQNRRSFQGIYIYTFFSSQEKRIFHRANVVQRLKRNRHRGVESWGEIV